LQLRGLFVNYQHDFHAGNFADVLKHAVLCRILLYLRDKPAAFRVIDTHAGSGLYDLAGEKALRGGEWQDGIGKLMAAEIPEVTAALLAPYLDVVRAVNDTNRLRVYPGSPALARAWLRAQDRLIACEIEPKASASLRRNLRSDARIKTLRIDGWTAINAFVPPRERRGLVLVDPSFETDSDFPRLVRGLAAAHRKWATGIYILWYPIKGRQQADALAKQVRRLAIRALRAELLVGPPSDQNRLKGAGLVIVNPPWTLENDLSALLPALSAILGPERKGGFRLDWLAGSPPGHGGSMASFHSPAVGV
jgi:23S rRNA (adenine2030-N6)-methyltransferase